MRHVHLDATLLNTVIIVDVIPDGWVAKVPIHEVTPSVDKRFLDCVIAVEHNPISGKIKRAQR